MQSYRNQIRSLIDERSCILQRLQRELLHPGAEAFIKSPQSHHHPSRLLEIQLMIEKSLISAGYSQPAAGLATTSGIGCIRDPLGMCGSCFVVAKPSLSTSNHVIVLTCRHVFLHEGLTSMLTPTQQRRQRQLGPAGLSVQFAAGSEDLFRVIDHRLHPNEDLCLLKVQCDDHEAIKPSLGVLRPSTAGRGGRRRDATKFKLVGFAGLLNCTESPTCIIDEEDSTPACLMYRSMETFVGSSGSPLIRTGGQDDEFIGVHTATQQGIGQHVVEEWFAIPQVQQWMEL